MFPLNLPNLLTVLRIMLVPVLVVALLGNSAHGDVLAGVVFALASLTDFVDGYLARARDAITTFGKLMDPLADKLLIVAALVSLVSLHRLAAWVAMVIITRELAVTVLRMGATQAGVVIVGEHVRQGQDLPADRGDPRADRRARPAAVGRRCSLYVDRRVVTVLSGSTTSSACAGCMRGARERGGASAPAAERRRRRRRATRAASSGAARASPRRARARSSPSRPWRSATTLCWWIVSRFSWRAETKRRVVELREAARRRRAIISRTQSSTKRGRRWAFSTTSTSSERFISS